MDSIKEREYLRDLAQKQLELAKLPEMQEKTKLWYAHNENRAERPVFTVEINTFIEELMPPLKCETKDGRALERQLLLQLLNYEYLHDDNVVTDECPISGGSWFRAFNAEPKRVDAYGADGRKTHGYHLDILIEDLEQDFDKIERSRWQALPLGQSGYGRFCEDTVGDILRVRYTAGFGCSLSRQLHDLMGMEGMFTALCDYPDKVHKVMRQLTDDLLAYMQAVEDNDALVLNNDSTRIGQGTRGYTDELPAADFASRNPARVLWRDMWGYLDSQETVSISPVMFEEFFFPYYKEIADKFGLLSYGCCEPVHSIWDNCLSKLTNLKKVSVSPWCDQQLIGSRLRGTKIIFHRKPRPDFLGVHQSFDETAFRAHLLETIQAACGCTLEFSYRDVYSLCGDKYRAKKAYDTAMDMFEKYWDRG